MTIDVRRVDYFYTTIRDRPGEGFKLLSLLSAEKVNFLAFGAMPMGPDRAQFTLYPENADRLSHAAHKNGLVLDGPHPALMVRGDDKLGALASVHERLYQAGINVYASTGVADGRGCFSYIIYVQPADIDRAVAALQE